MVVATVVLFYVSYWLLSKMEVVKWNHFVKSKVQDALDQRLRARARVAPPSWRSIARASRRCSSTRRCSSAAGTGGGAMPVVAGILLGSVVMVAVYIAINRFGVRLPLKPFFGVTSAFLYYMAFVFAGKGIAELQEGGLSPPPSSRGRPGSPRSASIPPSSRCWRRASWSLLLLVALVWTFVLEPRGASRGSVSARAAAPRSRAAAAPCRAVPRGAQSSSCSARWSGWRPTWRDAGGGRADAGTICAERARSRAARKT